MRFYLRSICELAIEAFVQARLLVAGRPDADALAAAGNPNQCPDLIEPPEYDAAGPTELDLTWHSIQTTRVGMAADMREISGITDEHFAQWDREIHHEEGSQ